ncbi:MAG TPA: hypothetical protein ENH10_03710 [Bacteroidetes bacterium]|nr:MG2 domain protein [bacterium BMS3Bbin04]HDO65123.1 hypothetical protein [Bacteroidota bacterium]HEX04248.1 hypothetical protein [Bacteroidota bacterium]
MIRKHITFSLTLLVLFAAFALVSCGDKNPIGGTPGNTDGPTLLVASLDLELADIDLSGYYGSQDTVMVTATARDNSGALVSDATVTITTTDFGAIQYVTGNNKTDSNGQLKARLIVTYLSFGENNQTEVQAIAGTVKSQTSTVTATTEDIIVVMTADPANAVALAGQPALSNITVRVSNLSGIFVPGVAINLEIINGASANLTEPVWNNATTSYTSTLSVDEVQGMLEVVLRAYVDVPGGQQITSVTTIGDELPAMVPIEGSPVLDGQGRNGNPPFDIVEQGEGAVADGNPFLGKGSVQLETWEANETLDEKSLRYTRAIVDADTVTVNWTVWGSQVSQIYLSISPDDLTAMPGENLQTTVTIVAADENNNGIPSLPLFLKLSNVNLAEGVGTISIPAITDTTGFTIATINTNGEHGTWVVEARTNPSIATAWTDTLQVDSGSEVVAVYLNVTPDEIYAEPGVSASASVFAIAYNELNNAVPYHRLHMTVRDPDGTPIGASIAQPDSTDSTGTAITTINTNGDYGDWVVEVRAYEDQVEPLATSTLSVTEGSAIQSINMSVDNDEVFCVPGGNEQIEVSATARDLNSSSLMDRLVYFKLVNVDGSPGLGTIAASDTTDSAGVAQVTINTEGTFGTWRVEARAFPTQTTALASREIEVTEGTTITEISMIIDPGVLTPAPQAVDTAYVRLTALDANGAGVENIELDVSIRNLDGGLVGAISQPDSTLGDGTTTSQILTNGRYGSWLIEARPYPESDLVFSTTIDVRAGSPQYFIADADSNNLAVRGTNGLEQTTVYATLYTENDVPTSETHWVYFLAESFPYSAGDEFRVRINDSYGQGVTEFPDPRDPLNGMPYDSALTVDGTAQVTVTSGSRKGLIRLRIWTEDDEGTEDIITQFDGVQIVSGPPAGIDVTIRPEVFDGGGAIWDLEISGRVYDARGNDVADGYTVYFEVDRPEVAHILDQAITGNESEHTSTVTPGVAFTTLEYASEHTNQEIIITGVVLDTQGNEVADSAPLFALPIGEPVGVMTRTPATWDYGVQGGAPGRFALRLDVFDGHGWPINSQLVSFSPAKGRIFKTDDINGEEQYFAYTGPKDFPYIPGPQYEDTDEVGVANRWFMITQDEAFPDPAVTETQVQVTADIIGVQEGTIEPITVFLIRDAAPAE